MIFIKTIEVSPEYIKKTLQFKDSTVLQINLKYPDIKIMPSGLYKKAGKKINNFYLAAVKNFLNFCEKELYKSAAFEFAAQENTNNINIIEDFKPFGYCVKID